MTEMKFESIFMVENRAGMYSTNGFQICMCTSGGKGIDEILISEAVFASFGPLSAE